MSSMYTDTYQFGATQLTIGLSATVQVSPGRCVNGGFFKMLTTGGTLCIVQGASQTASNGYPLDVGEQIAFSGPALFYLAAAGVTATIGLVLSYTAGLSQMIP